MDRQDTEQYGHQKRQYTRCQFHGKNSVLGNCRLRGCLYFNPIPEKSQTQGFPELAEAGKAASLHEKRSVSLKRPCLKVPICRP